MEISLLRPLTLQNKNACQNINQKRRRVCNIASSKMQILFLSAEVMEAMVIL